MAQPSQLSEDERRMRDDLDEVLRRANPNPERTGCPPRQTLIELAAKARAVGDPAYSHLSNCSECYREFRTLQDAPKVRGSFARATRRSGFVAAAALAGLVVAFSAIWGGVQAHSYTRDRVSANSRVAARRVGPAQVRGDEKRASRRTARTSPVARWIG